MIRRSAFKWFAADSAQSEVMAATLSAYQFPAHFHDTWSIGRIDRGVCRFSAQGQAHAAAPGDIVVIPPYVVHTGGNSPQSVTYRMAYVGEQWFSELSALVFGQPNVEFAETLIRDREVSQRLNEALTLKLLPEPRRKARLAQALICLLAKHGRRGATELAAPRFTLAEAINPLRVLDAVGAPKASRSTTIRRFTRIFGLPPARYLLNLRCVSAKALIRRKMAIAEIAQQLSFSDQPHFTREFKRVHGVTPGQYRRIRANAAHG
jgi:AraC-like DNA-binding protein